MNKSFGTLALLLSLGCGDADPVDTTPGGDGDADADAGADVTCEDFCAFEQQCDPEENLDDCLAYCDCIVPTLRPEFGAALWGCVTQSCDTSEDACVTSVAADLGDSPAASSFSEACLTRRTECGQAFSDDYCFGSTVADPVIGELDACLAEDCAAVPDCIVGILGACK